MDWHQLGRHLGIEMHILRDIDLDYQRVDRKRSEMFDSWLKSNPDASWEHIITALEDMKEIVLAGEIAQKHCGRRLTTGGPRGCWFVWAHACCGLMLVIMAILGRTTVTSMAHVDEQYEETVTLDEEEHLTGMSSSSSTSSFSLL